MAGSHGSISLLGRQLRRQQPPTPDRRQQLREQWLISPRRRPTANQHRCSGRRCPFPCGAGRPPSRNLQRPCGVPRQLPARRGLRLLCSGSRMRKPTCNSRCRRPSRSYTACEAAAATCSLMARPAHSKTALPENGRVLFVPVPQFSVSSAPPPQMPQSTVPSSEGGGVGGGGCIPANGDMQHAAPSLPTTSGSSPAPAAAAVPVAASSGSAFEPVLAPPATAAASASCSSARAESPACAFHDGTATASAPVSAELNFGSGLGSSDRMQSESDSEAKADRLPSREACRLQPAGGLPGSISIHRRASQISGSRQETSRPQQPQQLQASRLPGVLFQVSGRSGGIAAAVQRRRRPGTAEPGEAARASEPASLNSGVPSHLPLQTSAADAELPMELRAEGGFQAAQASTGTAASCTAVAVGLGDGSAAAHSRGMSSAGRTRSVRRVCRAVLAAVTGRMTEGPEADGGLRSSAAPHV